MSTSSPDADDMDISCPVTGEGGFGLVVKCRKKLDQKIYAVKEIVLEQTEMAFDKIQSCVRSSFFFLSSVVGALHRKEFAPPRRVCCRCITLTFSLISGFLLQPCPEEGCQ
ncbi:unnamed protein product, partial [Ilex paraguariensis]